MEKWQNRWREPGYREEDPGMAEEYEQSLGNGLSSFPDHLELEITSVKQLKGRGSRQRYRICFGEHFLEVHEDVMIKYRMIKGSAFTKDELVEIVQGDEKQKAYAAGLAYLSRKPRTNYEIALKLKEKGWEESLIEEITDRLKCEGLIDDAQYALEWTQQRVQNHGKGKLWIRQELRRKGISKPYIEAALGNVSEAEEFETARQLAEKRLSRLSGNKADHKRKIAAFLIRRGYSGAVASRVVRNLNVSESLDPDEEDFETWM
ncbi:regulatory protein RecX [Paenibacillus caui]|uniref:regulatory protein RecX n=1 Tax=Paenibacillus caui TaxID=2873927 RepID=UPI001CA92FCA|nr:RecX family transcriptional regulator [Paenibacillus caui]